LGIARATRAVSEAELRRAEEVWISSSTRTVSAVTTLDGQPVGSGKPGPVWQRMRQGIDELQRALATQPW